MPPFSFVFFQVDMGSKRIISFDSSNTSSACLLYTSLKRVLEELFGREKASVIPVLYGGSVNPGNVVPLISQPWVDGLFIGRSAWKAESFNRLIRMVLQSRTE